MDRYIKIAKFIPIITNLTTLEFAAIFYENIEFKYGSLKGIVSDRNIRITSKLWAEPEFQYKNDAL